MDINYQTIEYHREKASKLRKEGVHFGAICLIVIFAFLFSTCYVSNALTLAVTAMLSCALVIGLAAYALAIRWYNRDSANKSDHDLLESLDIEEIETLQAYSEQYPEVQAYLARRMSESNFISQYDYCEIRAWAVEKQSKQHQENEHLARVAFLENCKSPTNNTGHQ